MPSLNPEDLRARLQFDYQVVMRMRSPLMQVAAYRGLGDLKALRNPITSVDEGHLATHYLVDYRVKTLVGRSIYSDQTVMRVDVLAGTNYPYSEPVCWVLDNCKMPWSPHFLRGRPICTEAKWWKAAEGAMLLGQLLVHVAKLLNFDEPPRESWYTGYNKEAIDYWRDVLGHQPITKNFPYPQLPIDLVFDVLGEPESKPKKISVRKPIGTGAPVTAQPAAPRASTVFKKKPIGKPSF